ALRRQGFLAGRGRCYGPKARRAPRATLRGLTKKVVWLGHRPKRPRRRPVGRGGARLTPAADGPSHFERTWSDHETCLGRPRPQGAPGARRPSFALRRQRFLPGFSRFFGSKALLDPRATLRGLTKKVVWLGHRPKRP